LNGTNCRPYATQAIQTLNRTFRSIVPKTPITNIPSKDATIALMQMTTAATQDIKVTLS
jgi:hypothetical protein